MLRSRPLEKPPQQGLWFLPPGRSRPRPPRQVGHQQTERSRYQIYQAIGSRRSGTGLTTTLISTVRRTCNTQSAQSVTYTLQVRACRLQRTLYLCAERGITRVRRRGNKTRNRPISSEGPADGKSARAKRVLIGGVESRGALSRIT